MTSAAAADLSIRPVFRAQTNCSGALLADTTLELDPHGFFYGITISSYLRSPSAPPPCARASGRLRHWLVGLAVGHASGFFFSRRPAWQESSQHGSSFFPSRSPSTLHHVSQVPKIVIALCPLRAAARGAETGHGGQYTPQAWLSPSLSPLKP